MSAKIFCVGANHRTADIAQREAFSLDNDRLLAALPIIRDKYQLAELFVLSTCNRFEVMGIIDAPASSPSKSSPQLLPLSTPPASLDPINLWMDLHAEAQGPAPLDRSVLERITYTFSDLDAVRHAFRVASSLDSLIPGETQITGQFRDSVDLAQRAQTLGPILSRMSQEAITSAKKVRSQTSIGRRTVSIAHAAVTLAKRMFHDLSQCRFLIVGAGEMGRVAAEHAKSYQPRQIRIANRTAGRAYDLAKAIGLHAGYGLEDLETLLSQTDVVITATGAQSPIITPDVLKRSLKSREKATPIFLVDISLPRNIDPGCRYIDDVYLFDIDDLKQVVDKHLSERQAAAVEAGVIIDHATSGFGLWLATHDVAPVIEAWKNHVRDTLDREANKTLAKEIFSNLNPRQKSALDDMIEAMTARLSSDLAQGLRKANPDDSFQFAARVKEFFGLELPSRDSSKKVNAS